MNNQPIIKLKNVSKTLGNKTIVNDVSLDIYPGEIFGLLGPNGAGKTTTIRMLVGLVAMTEGKVFIKGVDLEKNFELAISQVGAIVENPELYDYLTGYQNLIHFSRMSGNISKKRINQIIQMIGLESAIQSKVKTYSLGMRQRLGLGQALMHSPSVLILDEPTNGLDPSGIREFRQLLIKLAKKEKMAVLVSSHLLAEMEMICDRIGIIQHGKLIDVQSVQDFVESEKELTVTFTVDRVELAKQTVQQNFNNKSFSVSNKTLEVHLEYNQVPQVTKSLVENGIKIYSIISAQETLEEKFIEVTGGQPIV
ncbi:ABC transporter ATP-binding protein [Evansella halocellulosilytica]|uniref:ABC transporter ATP-binding protein n=1 Tax=Evansella halocellulosilytica TaxID=2011013 RepID=UPI000BB90743|nr:ABC transporter ATP-binding protein [Evansella halocellulosilytica]